MSLDAMKQALEALSAMLTHMGMDEDDWNKPTFNQCRKAVTALRERLAQPQMQPCAGRNCGSTNPNLHSAECFEDYEQATGMNQWQGLADDEIKAPIQRAMQHFGFDPTQYSLGGAATIGFLGLVKEIEAKLKEKNT